MRQNKIALVVATTLAVTLAGCGGGNGLSGSSNANPNPKIQFSSEVTFGDSLSDVGTYNVGTIAALKGGRFTVNSSLASGAPAPTNWTELMAATLGQSAPCPYETGLSGNASLGFNVPVVTNSACTNYAQGSSRVTNPVGPGNALTGSPVGMLTIPVITQIQNHLAAHNGTFSGQEVVFVLAGANDIFMNLAAISAGAETVTQGVTAVGTAAGQLAGYVNQLILANGAKYVVVVNVPAIDLTPQGVALEAAAPGTQALIASMLKTFNGTLQAGLTSSSVLYVDANTVSADQIKNPAIYGLSNTTATACNLAYGVNPLATTTALGSSLVCNASNVIPGDISHYLFADLVHPTPYGNVLLARYVASQMAIKGWL
jgi:phospholipase/lecithinase/hemolysin